MKLSDWIFVPCSKCHARNVEVLRSDYEKPVCDYCWNGDEE